MAHIWVREQQLSSQETLDYFPGTIAIWNIQKTIQRESSVDADKYFSKSLNFV